MSIFKDHHQKASVLQAQSDTIVNRVIPLILDGHKYSLESLGLEDEDEVQDVEKQEETTELQQRSLSDQVRERDEQRARQRALVEDDTTTVEETEAETKPSNKDQLIIALNRVRELLRTLYGKTASLYKENARWFQLFLTKIEKSREALNDKEAVADAVKRYLIEKSKESPDEAEIDQDLQRKAELISEAYGLPDFMKQATTMGSFRDQLEKLLKTNRPVENMIPNVKYQFEERNFRYFGYKRSLKILSEEQLNFQKAVSNQFLKLVLTARKELQYDKLCDAVKNFTRGKKTINEDGFESFLLEEIIQPFYAFSVDKEVVGNISDDYALEYDDVKSVQDAFEEGGKDLEAFKRALASLVPNIKPANDDEKLNYFELRYDRELVIKYTQKLKGAVQNAATNRAHICNEEQNPFESNMMDRNSFEKLLDDARIDPESEAGLVLGKIILKVNAVMDDYINKTEAFWARVNNIQVKILNNQLNAINGLSADINE